VIVDRSWAASLAMAEERGLGQFVILHGVEQHRPDGRGVGAAGLDRPEAEPSGAAVGRGVRAARWRCCACKRGRACPDPGKHPRVIKDVQEHGHLDARPATELLELISELRYRPINLGIVPAADMLVLDVDPRNEGGATLRSLEARYGPLPVGLGVYTGGGGEHRWFHVEHATGNRVSSIGPGLDIKTAGGLLVAPPSVHLTGKRYAWTNRRHPPAPCPTWLDQVSRKPETISGGAIKTRSVARAQQSTLIARMARARPGELQTELFNVACWAYNTDNDLGPIMDAARGLGLTEHQIRHQVQGARRATR
jgi:Bifunctional DNA primase/polymerase, N-terminal